MIPPELAIVFVLGFKCSEQGMNLQAALAYLENTYDNSSTQQQKPEGDVKNHPSDGTPSDKA